MRLQQTPAQVRCSIARIIGSSVGPDNVCTRVVREQPLDEILYHSFRAQLLLEHYASSFHDSEGIVYATTRLIKLQQQLATTYGGSFNILAFARAHGNSLQDFRVSLPPTPREPDFLIVEAGNRTLSELRAALKAVRLN